MSKSRFNLQRHRAHEVEYLIERWVKFCEVRGLDCQILAEAGKYPVLWVRSAKVLGGTEPWIYLSAGVHGDEVAPPWALLGWAEKNWKLLKKHPFLIFPVLNPEGMALNTRVDGRGSDINREFHNAKHPMIAAWQEEVARSRYDLCLCLHEDYDGQGSYLYEFAPPKFGIGKSLLDETVAILPIDRRRDIDGHDAKKGWIYPKEIPQIPGEPEALSLVKQGCPRVITFETPSEFSLDLRIEAQQRFIRASVHHVLEERRKGRFLK